MQGYVFEAEDGSPRVSDAILISGVWFSNISTVVFAIHSPPRRYVLLEEVMQFNRMRRLQAPLSIVLQAVQSSDKLEVLLPWAAKVASGPLSDRVICETKIRCASQWEQWV